MHPTRTAYFIEQLKATPAEIETIEKLDPTASTSNGVWLLRGLREKWFNEDMKNEQAGTRILWESLLTFQRLKDSPKFKEAGYSSDLNTYNWEALKGLFGNYWDLLSNKQKIRNPKGCELVFDQGPWKVFRAFETGAAMALGSNSSWCTNGEGTCRDYLSQGNLWIYRLLDEPYAQLHVPTMQFQNKFNRSVMSNFLGGSTIADYALDLITTQLAEKYSEIRNFEKKLFPLPELSENFIANLISKGNPNLIRTAIPLFNSRKKDLEPILFGSGKYNINEFHNLVSYFIKVGDMDKQLDELLSRGMDPIVILAYIFTLRRKRWEEVENILESPKPSSEYDKLYKKYVVKYVGMDKVQIKDIENVISWISSLNIYHDGLVETLKTMKDSDYDRLDWDDLSNYFVRIKQRIPEVEQRLLAFRSPSTLIRFYERLVDGGLDIHPIPERLSEFLVTQSSYVSHDTLREYVKKFFKDEPLGFFEKVKEIKKAKEPVALANLYFAIVGTDTKCEWLEKSLAGERITALSDLGTRFLEYISKNGMIPELQQKFFAMMHEVSPYSLKNNFVMKCLHQVVPGFEEAFNKHPKDWLDRLAGVFKNLHPRYVEMIKDHVLASKDPNLLLFWANIFQVRLEEKKEELALSVYTNYTLTYISNFLPANTRVPCVEAQYARRRDLSSLIAYTKVAGRVPELEKIVLDVEPPKNILWYAEDACQGYFPEALPRLITAYRENLHNTRVRLMNRVKYPYRLAKEWDQLKDGLFLTGSTPSDKSLAKESFKTTYHAYSDPELSTQNLDDLLTDPKWLYWRETWKAKTPEEKKKCWFPRVKKVVKEKQDATV